MTVRGTVLQHGGVEHSPPAVDEDASDDPMASLILRLILREDSNSSPQLEFHFRGRWAVLLATLEPEDVVAVDGASAGRHNEDAWQVSKSSADAVVRIQRGVHTAVLDSRAVEAGEVPDWLKLPPTRAIRGGQYRYINYLCTLRDGIEANVFAVVLENARPGPQRYSKAAGTNILVVDKSQHNLPCSAWSSSPDLPQFSMQILLNDTLPEYLPFLCVGDVIRCHRVRIAARPPRFLNIRQQKHSSVIVFPISLSETAPLAAPGAYHPLTPGEHTVTDDDRDRAHALQSWVRDRLSRETISNYLATAQELSRSPANRDVVVKVLRVIAAEQVLVVVDGSTREALHVKASEPALAGNWLFHHVKAGMWLKLRNCAPGEECDLVVSAAMVTRMPPWCFDVLSRAANMAARPPIDESAPPELPPALAAPQPPARAEGLDEMACAGVGFADTEVDTEEAPAPEVAEAVAPSPSAVDVTSPIRCRAAHSDCAASLVSPLAIARAVDLQSPPKNVLLSTGSGGASSSAAPFSMVSGGASSSVAMPGATPGNAAGSLSPPAASRETLAPGDRVVLFGLNKQARLNGQEGVVVKLYSGEGSRQRWLIRMESDKQELALRMTNLRHAKPHTVPVQAPAVPAAPLAVPQARLATMYGLQSMIRITELSAALETGQRSLVLCGFHVQRVLTGARGHSLLRARCKVCGASFAWQGGEERGAKRRRFALPCSHWLFDLAFEFELELRDAAQPNAAIEVAVRDQQGTLFGMTPQAAASDPAELDRAQELLRHLLAYDGQANAMAVLVEYRFPRDVLVACDTGIVQIGE